MIKYFLWSAGLLLSAMPARAQTAATAQQVAGTHVWLIAPAGFAPAPGLTGLRRGPAVLQVFDGPGSNFYRQAAGFTAARFTSRGGQVLELLEVAGATYPARLARVRLSAALESAQVLFGDSSFAVLLEARYPAADTAAARELRRSLRTATYRKTTNTDPRPTARYGLDETKSTFRFAGAEAGTSYYTPEGRPAATLPVLALRLFDYNPGITAATVGEQMRNAYPGLRNYLARTLSSGKVNGLVTYETEGAAELNGQRVLLYQQVSVVGNTAVAMLGLAPLDSQPTLGQFKTLTHTIKDRTAPQPTVPK